MQWRMLAALLVAVIVAPGRGDTGADAEAKPLPVDHTTILKSGGTYFVEGRVRIPKGVEITMQKDSKLFGRGKDATIEVAGTLTIHGVGDSVVPVTDVTIEVQPEFEGVRLDMASMGGSSRGIVTPKGKSSDGRIMVLNTEFKDSAGVDLTMIGNEVDLQRVYARSVIRVKAVDPAGSTGNKVKLNVLNCCSTSNSVTPGALQGGLLVEKVNDVTVRATRFGGDKVSFTDCGSVAFDGNQLKCRSVEFSQSAAGRFGATSMSNCDVLCEKVVFWSPATPGKTDVVSCDKCWFEGEGDEKVVRTKYLRDSEDDPKCGVTVKLTKVMERPLLLAGKIAK